MIKKIYPKISVVTTSYNQGRFLEETIKSVLDQGYPNLEYIIIDGKSTDNSVDIIKRHQQKLAYWVSEPDKCHSEAINKGFAVSTGEIMAWLNSDDLFLPGSLALIADEFTKQKETDVLFGDRLIIDSDSKKRAFLLARPVKGDSIRYFNTIPQETIFWRRRIWEKLDYGLDETILFALDYDLFVRFALHNARFHHISKFIGACRFHEDTKTSKIGYLCDKDIHLIRKKYFGNPTMREDIGKLPKAQKAWWFFKEGLFIWLFLTRIRSYILSKRIGLPSREMLWN